MDNKPVYNGIDIYKENNNKLTQITILSIVFILMLITAFYFGIKMLNSSAVRYNILNEKEIKNYIDLVDEVSTGKAQINWKEVAAICEAYGQGHSSLVSNNDKKSIASIFLKNNGNGKYRILSIDEVMNRLKFSDKDKMKSKQYLILLAKSSLYRGLYDDKEKVNFINSLEESANENYRTYGILPSITMAQAILESGWGKSKLAVEHNNLFGIKADDRWAGAVATITTKENHSDMIEANFREYSSILDSIKDHALFLANNERYTINGVFAAKDYKAQAEALQNAGYSTAKDENGNLIYAQKLINVIQNYNLMLYDYKAQK